MELAWYLMMAPRASNSTEVDWKFLWHWPVCIAASISDSYTIITVIIKQTQRQQK